MKAIIANIVRGCGKTLSYLLAAFFMLCAAQSARAATTIDMGGNEASTTDLSSYSYGGTAIKDNELRNGTLNVTGNQGFAAGTFTFGSGLTINQTSGQWGIAGSRAVKFIDGATLNYTSTSDIYFGRLANGTTYTGTTQLILDGGIVNASAQLCFTSKVTSSNYSKDVVLNFTMSNNSVLTLPTNKELRFGEVERADSKSHKTVKVRVAVTGSTITAKQVRVGQESSYISDTANSFNNITFGSGTVLNVGQVYSYLYPAPTVVFDGAKINWLADTATSLIGQNDGVTTSIYTIGPNGLVINKDSGYSRTSVSSYASPLAGTGGITKTGAGDITWNTGRIGSSTSNPMTFTGPLVVSNGTWTSSLGYAASAFKANGGTLVLSGALSAANVAFEATDGGTLTLTGATITDSSPDLTLAGGGSTDYFTRDGAVATYTLDSLTLGEGAVLDIDANATTIDVIDATTTNITATAENKATINLNFLAVPSPGQTFTLIETDSADKFTVIPKMGTLTLPSEVSVVDGTLTLTITAEDYIWNASQTNWGDAGAWNLSGTAADWADGNNAIFSTANAEAVVAAAASPAKVSFTADGTVSGSATLTVPSVSVASGVTGTIAAPTAGTLEKTGPGTLTLGASRTEATTLTEGTLAMSGSATLDWTKLTLGTANAVTLGITDGATMTSSTDLVLGNASGANATLVVGNGGTVTVNSSKWVKSVAGTGTINLNGGTLVAKHLHIEGGTLAVNFNGGTLKANSEYSINGGLIHSDVTVFVGAGGGTIDSDNLDITVSAAISGNGGMTFKGGGSVTLASGNTYTGTTTVEVGTTVHIPSASALQSSKIEVMVPETAPEVAVYTPVIIDGDGTLPSTILDDIELPTGVTKVRLSGDGKSVICVYGTPVNTWIGGATGSLNVAGNWSRNSVPQSGENCVIGSTAEATLTVGDTFAPASITFAADSAAITINAADEEAISGITAVTNLSSASHTINARVNFAGAITVAQNARGYLTREQSHVTFAGGAYAAAGYTIAAWGEAAAGYSHAVFGKYYFANTETSRFQARDYKVSTSGDCRFTVTDGSSLYIPYAGDLKEIEVLSGGKVDVGNVAISATDGRLSHNNYGEMVVTNLTVSGTGTKYVSYNQGTDTAAVFKFNAVTNSMTENWFYFTDANVASKHTIYIGEGGLNFNGTVGVYVLCQRSGDVETVRPWYSDFTIANRSDGGQAVVFNGGEAEFNTSDESGTGRTITVDAKTRVRGSSTVKVSGAGTLKLNKSPAYDSSDKKLTMSVNDTATLSLASGVTLGATTTTVAAGATLEVAESGTVALGGDLTLQDGATLKFTFTERRNPPVLDLTDKAVTFGDKKAIKVTLSGERPAYGTGKYYLTQGGAFSGEGIEILAAAEQPKWVKAIGLYEGNIYAEVCPAGMMILFR